MTTCDCAVRAAVSHPSIPQMATPFPSPRLLLHLLFLLLPLLLYTTSAQPQPPPPPTLPRRLSSRQDLAALYSLRASLSLRSRDWPRKADPCLSWSGVRCDPSDGRVVAIDVSGLRRTRIGKLHPRFAVDGLRNLTRLISFRASGFGLPGPIPGWIGPALAPTLAELDLAGCGVTGGMPPSLGLMEKLVRLNLSRNGLTGPVPDTLGGVTGLKVLDLSRNNLSGNVPQAWGRLRNLTLLYLSSNSLSHAVPEALARMSSLLVLDLSDNLFTGMLPESLFSSTSFPQLQSLALRRNNLSGTVPDSLWALPHLRFLDLSANNLTGNISASAAATRLFGAAGERGAAALNLSGNSFYGEIPPGVPQLFRRLAFVDISGNFFQGLLSPLLTTPINHSNVTIDRNCFRNATNQRTATECEDFYAKIGLTYDQGLLPPTTNQTNRSRSRSSRNRLIYILLGVFGGLLVTAILVAILVLCIRRKRRDGTEASAGRRRRRKQSGSTTAAATAAGGAPSVPPPSTHSPPTTTPPPPPTNLSAVGDSYTYDQLLQATSNFDDANLIAHGHSGDLYRATLDPPATLVAVKRVDLTPTSRLLRKDSYLAELDLFARASHTRLVPLLGHCLQRDDVKCLVYRFMPNADLSTALYRKQGEHDDDDDGLQSLDWITRLKIATGAAEGLCYLHHECNPPIVHRDIQASSILLDDKFEVRLGSLSEVCLQEDEGTQNVITRLLRISQSSEPSTSGSSRPTCAYDVYCFGKVLLELVTGKLGISGSNDPATNELMEQMLSYISVGEKELLTKILDPSLIVDDDLMEEVWAMAIVAKSCLNPKPSKRPQVKYILKALENPLKVVREENTSSARLKATSSRTWNAVLFGSWRSTSDVAASSAPPRDVTSYKPTELASSHESPGEQSFNHRKKPSKEIFPEPTSSSS